MQSSFRRRIVLHSSEKYARRGFALPSFSGGLGSRLLKTAEKDPSNQAVDQPPANANPDPPKRASIFSRPASSIPPNKDSLTGLEAKPRFSLAASLQSQNLRKSSTDTWTAIPGTLTNPAARAAAAQAATQAASPIGLQGARSIRDFARQAADREKSDSKVPGRTMHVEGGKGLFSGQEISDMRQDIDPKAKPLSSANAIREDLLGTRIRREAAVDLDDSSPKEEQTAGEIRYLKYQVCQGTRNTFSQPLVILLIKLNLLINRLRF